jgi:hypothetical protein
MKVHHLCILFLAVFFSGVSGINAGGQQATPMSSEKDKTRLTVFISDLHIGPGKEDNEPQKWMNIEDFRWNEEFNAFLDFINIEGKGNADLIILGDMFELWQSADMFCTGEGKALKCAVRDCEHGDKNLGCTEKEALVRIKRAISQHADTFNSLNAFVSKGTNRIIILPGNHDAALFYPQVAQEVVSAIARDPANKTDCNSGNRIYVSVSMNGYWLSPDGLIYADHGHSFDKANKFDKWPKPFKKRAKQIYLQRPFGEQMVQKFYNRYEEQFPILDNLSEEKEGIRLGFETKGIGLIDDVAEFGKFLLVELSWNQFVSGLGKEDGLPPKWDIDKILAKNSPEFLIDAMGSSNDRIQEAAQQALKQGKFKLRPSDFTKDELVRLCDYKLLLQKNGDEKVKLCDRVDATNTGALIDKIANRDIENRNAYLIKVYESLITKKVTAKPFSVYLYGHTHNALILDETIVTKGESWDLQILNTGAFQRVATRAQIEEIKKQRQKQNISLTDRDILTTLQPEDLPACYTYVRIDPYENAPEPALLYWVKNKDRGWVQSTECSW